MEHDAHGAISRVVDSMSDDFTGCSFALYEKIAKHCDSPIEAMLGTAFYLAMRLFDLSDMESQSPSVSLCLQENIESQPASAALLIPQYQWQTYRIDWAVRYATIMVFIECDGHFFHNVTKEQAQKDRERDRDIQAAGIPVIRFTGSEIYKSPGAAAAKVIDFLTARIRLVVRP